MSRATVWGTRAHPFGQSSTVLAFLELDCGVDWWFTRSTTPPLLALTWSLESKVDVDVDSRAMCSHHVYRDDRPRKQTGWERSGKEASRWLLKCCLVGKQCVISTL